MDDPLPPKEISCECGNRFVSQQHSNWCNKCGRQIFYTGGSKLKGRINKFYFTVLILATVLFLSYFFIEMILTPVLNNLR